MINVFLCVLVRRRMLLSVGFSHPSSTVKPLPLSPLEPQSSTPVGGAGERQALELRVRAVEEENQALRRELSRPPRSPSARLRGGGGRHGNQSRTHSEEGTGDSEGQKAAAVRNSSDCVQQPAVDKCEVSSHPTLKDAQHLLMVSS